MGVYHRIKAALLRDPIWGDLQSLQTLSADLLPEDRFTSRHHGRRRLRTTALHQASIDVRYGIGLPSGALPGVLAAIERIEQLDQVGDLQAAIPSR